jgi:hypothetical protein
LHERSVGKPLARLNFSPVSARPRRMLPRRRRIKKLRWSLPPFPTTLAASRSNSGGRDEATVGQQGSLLPLPPCSPELNPQENIWQSYIRLPPCQHDRSPLGSRYPAIESIFWSGT